MLDPTFSADALYLEDLKPGDRFVSGTHQLDAAQIKSFAGQFDPQVFHLDEAVAEHTFFKGLAASGWHTAAITMKLLVSSGLRLAGGVIGAGTELTWPAPTRPNDLLRAESEIIEIIPSQSRPDRGMVRVRTETVNQDGTVVQIMVGKLLVRRRPLAGS